LEPLLENVNLPNNDFRKVMSHPIFSAPKSAAAILQSAVNQLNKTEQVIASQCIGQAIGKNSILLYSENNVPKLHAWDINDVRTQNWNPFTMTLQEVENLPGKTVNYEIRPVEAFHEADSLNEVTPETGRRRSRSGERNSKDREPQRKSSAERAAKERTARKRSEPTKERE